MPKVSIYPPGELYRRARERELPLSSLAQEAIAEALAADDNARWIRRMAEQPPRTSADVDVSALMEAVRDEFGS